MIVQASFSWNPKSTFSVKCRGVIVDKKLLASKDTITPMLADSSTIKKLKSDRQTTVQILGGL